MTPNPTTDPIAAPRALARIPWRPLTWGAAALLFTAPVVAGLTVDGWLWTAEDYIAAAAMIFGSALLVELGLRLSHGNAAYRFAFAGAVLASFLTVWINLAVGIIGDEGDPLNLMYFVALLAMAVACLATRFRPRGMAAIMFAMAASHFVIAGVAQANGYFVWVIAGFFALLWTVSSGLFRYSLRGGAV